MNVEVTLVILFCFAISIITPLAMYVGYTLGKIKASKKIAKVMEDKKQDMLTHIIGVLQNPMTTYTTTSTADKVPFDRKGIIEWYEEQIRDAIERDAFEEAAELRDQLKKIKEDENN